MNIYDQLKESYTVKNTKNIKKEIINNLVSVGISDAERVISLYPHQLSGGMKQRVMIAMAIACKPKLLIADEPTTSLDVTIQKHVLDLLLELKNKMNMSILFITHDLAVASQISDKIIVMRDGEIIEKANTTNFFKNPKNTYSKSLLDSTHYLKKENKKETNHNDNTLDIKNLRVYFEESKSFFSKQKKFIKAVDDVSIKIKTGSTHAIVGESGSGKTTVAKAVMGLAKITSGSIKIQNKDISNLSSRETINHRKNYQMIFQDPFSSLNPRMRIGAIIKEGLCFLNPEINKKEMDFLLEDVLYKVGMTNDA
jgi:peptide/nickel transport system ATP-binding protein